MALIMYDLDGTLLDTAQEITQAVNLTLRHYQHGTVDEIEVRRWIGHGTGFLMQQAWAANGSTNEAQQWDSIMRKFGEYYEQTAGTTSRPYEQVIETLELLKSKGFKQAIITNKEGRYTQKIVRSHGLEKYMDMVISGDTLAVKKPHPGVIEHCLHELDVMSGQSIFIGDSETDLATARAAGIVCWAVPYGYNHGRPIAMADPDRVIPDISYVSGYFEGM